VGDKRILVPVEVSGLFNTPHLYANPFVFPLAQDILGEECILGSFGAVAALPGAEDQHTHRDHPFLFQEEAIDTAMPAYAVTVIVPLVDVNEHHGTTRVCLAVIIRPRVLPEPERE
jgi:ectoine hydroxylase-related dioxygenase (phytanoyl-CoA dioxygenase family)